MSSLHARARTDTFDEESLRQALSGRKILLTGHSGFKGGWMALWLQRLGAEVVGVSLPPERPSFHDAVHLSSRIDGRWGDIRSPEDFGKAVADVDADAIVHMAAQAIVRQCHSDPVDAYLTNVVGTAVVLNAARAMPRLKGILVVTSDKCYENNEWAWGYRESDPLGGKDPYSSSKACTELVAAAYRRSWFSDPAGPQLATVRAGNVFGGGDWAADRLIPDLVRAACSGHPVHIRNPGSIRPWQHVLEPVAGYLSILAGLLTEGAPFAEAWNFGPDPTQRVTVGELVELVADSWGPGRPNYLLGPTSSEADAPREAGTLALDSAKAHARLGWKPRLELTDAIRMTVDWYRQWALGSADMAQFTLAQIDTYVGAGSASHSMLEYGDELKCA